MDDQGQHGRTRGRRVAWALYVAIGCALALQSSYVFRSGLMRMGERLSYSAGGVLRAALADVQGTPSTSAVGSTSAGGATAPADADATSPLAEPSGSAAAACGRALRLLHWNTGQYDGMDTARFEGMMRFASAGGYDVVTFNELRQDEATFALAARRWGFGGMGGSALLQKRANPTKLGMISRHNLTVTLTQTESMHHGILCAATAGVNVCVTHLSPRSHEKRLAEAERISALLRAADAQAPVLLLGDVNCPPRPAGGVASAHALRARLKGSAVHRRKYLTASGALSFDVEDAFQRAGMRELGRVLAPTAPGGGAGAANTTAATERPRGDGGEDWVDTEGVKDPTVPTRLRLNDARVHDIPLRLDRAFASSALRTELRRRAHPCKPAAGTAGRELASARVVRSKAASVLSDHWPVEVHLSNFGGATAPRILPAPAPPDQGHAPAGTVAADSGAVGSNGSSPEQPGQQRPAGRQCAPLRSIAGLSAAISLLGSAEAVARCRKLSGLADALQPSRRKLGSCAVVGGSGVLSVYPHGPLIDAHDYVFRVNACPVAGFEPRVGRRTDVRFVNAPQSRKWLKYAVESQALPPPLTTTRHSLMWVDSESKLATLRRLADASARTAPVRNGSRPNAPAFQRLTSAFRTKCVNGIFTSEDRAVHLRTNKVKNLEITFGFESLMHALYSCERVSVFGFFLDTADMSHRTNNASAPMRFPYHYWENVTYDKSAKDPYRPWTYPFHNFGIEEQKLRDLQRACLVERYVTARPGELPPQAHHRR